MKLAVAVFLIFSSVFALAQQSRDYLSAEKKFAAVTAFEANPVKGGSVTSISDAELNAWLNEGGVKWSDGVSDVRMSTDPGVIHGSAQVDFDKVTAKARTNNPLMMMFTGLHIVRVTATAAGSKGRGRITVQSVSLDGLEIPKQALELFIQHYLQPKYPEVDLDTIIGLPYRIDTAVVGDGQITLTQR
ncbi:hypothetical protein Acid345_3858 [Candidatus Koribacter versatilis Ellin345]|uniref:DUF2993 domain-containing protein n=1 Tax=Koribacter versatilis (strain Ellin345) TaxID=204669 RepID=Q1IJU2_KORVE|nr:hypothetical protein [Candidatus Koribacter versatilis]ABF42858.1 hypothetical protein Acid345_3858 [Candidatus Koribacter versatilis Ellin345]